VFFLGDATAIPSNSREMVVGFRVSLLGERRSGKRRRWFTWVGSMAMLATLPVVGACAPKVSAGVWQCSGDGGTSDGGAGPADTDPVAMPWSTGFEEGFCDYTKVAGYCYGDDPYVLVTEPHHLGGRFSAEFKVKGGGLEQTRCVRQGVLPEAAYYGAWYFIPEPLTDPGTAWNLFHFAGGDSSGPRLPALWDVHLAKIPQTEDWELVVYDPVSPPPDNTYRSADPKRVPFGKWFHIELFLKRASDNTGEIALYQDGVQLFEHVNLRSDASKFSQWYVGDWAEDATPADSSLFVDDVSIRATLSSASATQ